jgi:hypothetical protein
MPKVNAANANGAGAGRWVLGIVALMCAGAYGGVAWQKGTLDPMVLLLGPTHSDPETKHPSREIAKKVDPELSEELIAAQYEPDDESEPGEEGLTTDSDLEMSVSDEDEPGSTGIRPAGYEIDADSEEAEVAVPEEAPPARTAARVRDTDAARDAGTAKKKSSRATNRD